MNLFDRRYDLFGRKRSKKRVQKERFEESKRRGKSAEDNKRFEYEMRGYEMERTGRGSDFRARRRNTFTGRVERSFLVEVKSGKAKLSKLQRKTKKKKSNYRVERENPFF